MVAVANGGLPLSLPMAVAVAAKLGARRNGWNVQQADRRCKRLTNKTSRCVVGHIVMPPMRSAANWKRAGVQAGSLLAL